MAYELLRLFADLVRCETRLYNHLDDELRARHGLATSQYEFLRYVQDHQAARVADLAAEFAIGVGATSKGVDRLERHGWLVRLPNPVDRRSTTLALTDKGLALLDDADSTVRTQLTLLFGGIADHELEPTRRTLAALRSTLERSRLGVPAG